MDKVYGAGLAIGTLQGVTPFGTVIDGIQTSAGVGIQGPRRYQFGKATGQAIGGLALMVLGSGGTIGGAGLNLTGLGAVIGVPATALSVGLVAAGAENALAGMAGMWQSLSSGGLSGPVANGPAAPAAGPKPAAPKAPTLHKHHIATNKNSVSDARGGPWTPKFEKIFKRAGMSLDDPANIVDVPGHYGPHPEAYHLEVFNRLDKATDGLSGNTARQALTAQLNSIRTEILTPGSVLNKLLTGQ